MAKTTINEAELEKAINFGLLAGAQFLENKIIEITPRDPKRPPKDLSKRVTGHLKQSISHEKISNSEYKIGVRSGFYDTEIYGAAQEYGTIKLPPRSFIRKGLDDNKKQVINMIQNAFNQYLSK